MQRRRRAAVLAAKPGRRQGGIIPQQSLDRLDVTCVNRQTQLDRTSVAVGDPLVRLLLTHRGSSCQPPETACRPRRCGWGNLRLMVPALAAVSAAQASYRLEWALVQVVLTWEPVSGFEPLTCRLQDGCSAN